MVKRKRKKSVWKKIWDFLWKSDSIWSWLADLVLIFLIVKFILFPVFSLALSTSLPFVIIESGSLEHRIIDYNTKSPNICGLVFEKTETLDLDRYWQLCGDWYGDRDITKKEFENWSYPNGLNKGDIIVVHGLKNYDYIEGDIIIFKVAEQTTPIIHRIIDVKVQDDEKIFSTKGDHNSGQLPYEHEIKEEQLIGKAIIRIPKIGWVKLVFVEAFRG